MSKLDDIISQGAGGFRTRGQTKQDIKDLILDLIGESVTNALGEVDADKLLQKIEEL